MMPQSDIQTTAWSVLTGPPGSGKTTLLSRLQALGYPTKMDPARVLIEEQVQSGKSVHAIRANEVEFRNDVIAAMVQDAIQTDTRTSVIFDYGIPDNLAFARLNGISISDEMLRAASRFRYSNVFLLSPLPLVPDPIRVESVADQRRLHKLIEEVYQGMGYNPISITTYDTEERLNEILSRLPSIS